ncbi:GNAT family N-acyltransferase [Stenotrophomonas sp. MMGLT7]|uniref:lysophospholipid acyltransferase family protein n=1 Tax=Stenotrophomonas sp. MMGLT7 TaxID=2901227 RepID=UPI001E57A6B6|nr:GNAT family N-acyltransferase [Stenotrophomonas sp. MMGLT7]MCD7098241.1 lysophospholipid acyltransferase family protein [Stenotrophomonas sp. MMGLT7]
MATLLEQTLQQQYPGLFSGRRAKLVRPLLRGFGRWSGLGRAERFLAGVPGLRGLEFVRAALDFLQTSCEVAAADLQRIPRQGRVLVLANHPSGARDALALLEAVGRVRGDVCIVANDWLQVIEPLRELLLPVRILGGQPSRASVMAVEQALRQERCVIVFPAGEVSRLGWRGVRDGRWRRGFLHFARRTGAPLLPVCVQARNSALFYGASALFRPAGTVLLAHETLARQRPQRVKLHIGQPRRLPADGSDDQRELHALRRELYALGKLAGGCRAEPLAAPLPPQRLAEDVATLELLGHTLDGKQVRYGTLAEDAPLLLEIGRLRELTFREVGEGSGLSRDLDRYDAWYEHIVLWDGAAGRIVGAYRVARCAGLLARRGLAGLYSASLFDYDDAMVPRLAQALELGRSFVVPDYWGSRSIDYLWQGIGAYLRRHPQIRYLVGAVSISAALPPAAREQIVAYYRRYHAGGSDGVAARRPFAPQVPEALFGELDAATAMRVLKDNLDALGAAVPMLYKQYTELCEPGGARFLAFGVDPDFSDTVDGLIEVDLQRLKPKKRERYLGAAAAREASITSTREVPA